MRHVFMNKFQKQTPQIAFSPRETSWRGEIQTFQCTSEVDVTISIECCACHTPGSFFLGGSPFPACFGVMAWTRSLTLRVRHVKGNFGDAASYLVEKGADANDVYVDEGGDRHSLLMDAIIVENVPFAELLVKHGADVNVTDEQGVTILIQVCTGDANWRTYSLTLLGNQGLVPTIVSASCRRPVDSLNHCCGSCDLSRSWPGGAQGHVGYLRAGGGEGC